MIKSISTSKKAKQRIEGIEPMDAVTKRCLTIISKAMAQIRGPLLTRYKPPHFRIEIELYSQEAEDFGRKVFEREYKNVSKS